MNLIKLVNTSYQSVICAQQLYSAVVYYTWLCVHGLLYIEDSIKCISLRQYINTASKFT